MLVAMYEGADEVLVFAMRDGEAQGTEEYFKPEGDRDPEDYDLKLVELPLAITASLKTEPERVHQ